MRFRLFCVYVHTDKQNGGSHEDSKPDLRRSVQKPDGGRAHSPHHTLSPAEVVKVDMRAHEYSNDEREDEDNGMGISGHSCEKYFTDGWGGYYHYHFDYLNDGENYATLEINFKSVK